MSEYDSDDYELDEFITDEKKETSTDDNFISQIITEDDMFAENIIINSIDILELYSSINKCINYDTRAPICKLEKNNTFKIFNDTVKRICKKIG